VPTAMGSGSFYERYVSRSDETALHEADSRITAWVLTWASSPAMSRGRGIMTTSDTFSQALRKRSASRPSPMWKTQHPTYADCSRP
jgi:hypothetical protein